MPDDLYADALLLAMNKNLVDVTTLLQWAHTAESVSEKLKHTEQAIALLTDVRDQLKALHRVRS